MQHTKEVQPITKVESAFEGVEVAKKALEQEVTVLLDAVGQVALRLVDVLEPEPGDMGSDTKQLTTDGCPRHGVALADRIAETERFINGQRSRVTAARVRLDDIVSRVQL